MKGIQATGETSSPPDFCFPGLDVIFQLKIFRKQSHFFYVFCFLYRIAAIFGRLPTVPLTSLSLPGTVPLKYIRYLL